jgi:peptidyl-prolyl cis-trans isomerase D
MLHVFRESVGRFVAIAILALIAVTFIFFGIDFSVTQLSFAAKVNGESIAIRDFERELQLLQNQYQRQLGIELTDDIRRALRQQVLEEMVMRETLLQSASDAGYRVSNARLIDSIRNIDAFQVGGEFSADVYRSRLTAEQLTPSMFEDQQREQATLVELQRGIAASAFITPAEFRRNIELYYERREIAWALFAAADFLEQVEITEDEIADYHAENGDRFMTPESVDIEFVELTLESIAASIEISEDELRAQYEAEAERYANSEERRVRHILFEVEDDDTDAARARAQSARERLDAGEDFATLAAELSDDIGTRNSGGDLGWIARGVLPTAFEDALFGLAVGETAGPVETEFGFHVLRLDEVRAGQQLPFEVAREQLREELASDRAYTSFLDLANELDEAAYEAGDDLAGIAERFGLMLETIEGLTRNGGADRFIDPAPVIAAAFDPDAIASGNNSALIDLGQDRAAIVRVTRHNLPEPEALEDVADEIRDLLANNAASELAMAAAGSFLEELDTAAIADGSLDPAELAASHGGSWNEARWVERDDVETPAEILQSIFARSRPAAGSVETLRVPVGVGDEAVVLLSGVQAGVPDEIASEEREQGQQQLIGLSAEAEMQGYAADARQRARVRVPDEVIDPDL